MSKIIGSQTNFSGGISFSDKEGIQNSYAFDTAIDHRSDPKSIVLNPRSEKDSGSVVQDLPVWGTRACSRTFSYGNTGKIYQKSGTDWSLVHSASSSQGNGMEYFTADSALYYAQNTTFGRLLDACTASTFYDDFLGSEGGDPTNTKSIDLEASSSQYASRADTASLSITGDLSIETHIKPESLPAVNATMVLVSKWDEQTDKRSYKFDITALESSFGDGSDGALTISTNTTDAPIDSACTGTVDTYTLSATNASFAANQRILIHQTQGANAGTYQETVIESYTAGTITTRDKLIISYVTGAQVLVIKQYTTITVNSGVTWRAKKWDGTVGGILSKRASTSVTVNGTIDVGATPGGGYGLSPCGFRGATTQSGQGEGTSGAGNTVSTAANGNGGGGGSTGTDNGGGGGGHANAGTDGLTAPSVGLGGSYTGSANLSTMTFGGGGGRGGDASGEGGVGGGIIDIASPTITVHASTGYILSSGSDGQVGSTPKGSGGGGGAGGSIRLRGQTLTLGTNRILAQGGIGGNSGDEKGNGGNGSLGRVAIGYYTSVSGTSTPAFNSSYDPSLSGASSYFAQLSISSTGANSEVYQQQIDVTTGTWTHLAVTWDASASTAIFYQNSTAIGTKIGALTAIDDNASTPSVGCDFNSSGTARNFYDGLMDELRIWNDVRTASEISTNANQTLFGTEANLVAYYQFESGVTDSQTDGLNDLTASGSPTYSDDVPFSGITTRNDQDQGLTSGSFVQSYTLTTAINEGATHRQTFVPAKDPQKSIIIDIDTVSTGDITITVHDSLNREVATGTILVAEQYTGFYEVFWDSVWRPIIGASYHFHVTSTVADGALDTTGASDLETAYFTTHYQFLVSDQYHPMKEFLDFMVIGNERYLAKFEAGNTYEPHKLTFPSGYRVRSLAYWREFLVIGCWKGTAITDFDDGRIFFWDGISDTYNHSIPVPEGGVNAMFGTQDVLFIVAGYTGEILVYSGGGSAQKFNKIPKLQSGEYVEISPGSMNMWRSNIHMGVSLNTDSESIHKGVYSIGTSNSAYAPSLGFDHPTSLGDQTSSNVNVGMIFPSGQNLYVGWENNGTFGIDSINPTNDSYSDGTIELLISDMGQISKEKYPLIIRADFEPLSSGESVRLKYKADRESSWKVGDWEDSSDAKETKMRIPERMKEIQVACDLRTTVSTSPKLLGISVVSEMEESSAQNE